MGTLNTKPLINLKSIDDFSYSAILRQLNQQCSNNQVLLFKKLYKLYFDNAIINNLQKPDAIALQNALVVFNKKHKILLDKDIVKSAAISELGDPRVVGKYLSDIIRFTLTKISPEKRPKAIFNLRNKIYNLNAEQIAMKNLPATSAIGQSITFVKHVLFNHNPKYVREVLNSITRNLTW